MLDISAVTDRLYVGAGPTSDEDVQALIAQGINWVIDCRMPTEFNAAPLFVPYMQIQYESHGTPDWHPPEERQVIPTGWFHTGWYMADNALDGQMTLLICCHAGRYRSPALVYYVLRRWGIKSIWAECMIMTTRRQAILGIAGAEDAEAALKEGW